MKMLLPPRHSIQLLIAYLEKLHYKLYKYQRVLYSEAEKDNYLRLKNHLKCHKISLSCPSKFNDPFDCQFAFPDDLGENFLGCLKIH